MRWQAQRPRGRQVDAADALGEKSGIAGRTRAQERQREHEAAEDEEEDDRSVAGLHKRQRRVLHRVDEREPLIAPRHMVEVGKDRQRVPHDDRDGGESAHGVKLGDAPRRTPIGPRGRGIAGAEFDALARLTEAGLIRHRSLSGCGHRAVVSGGRGSCPDV